MKKITFQSNSKIVKTASFTFNYLHLIMIAAVLLLFSVENANAQSSFRTAATQPAAEATPELQYALAVPTTSTSPFDVYSKYKQVAVSSPQIITSMTVFYHTSGRTIFQTSAINSNEYKTPPLDVPNQVLIVRLTFANNTTATKKVHLN